MNRSCVIPMINHGLYQPAQGHQEQATARSKGAVRSIGQSSHAASKAVGDDLQFAPLRLGRYRGALTQGPSEPAKTADPDCTDSSNQPDWRICRFEVRDFDCVCRIIDDPRFSKILDWTMTTPWLVSSLTSPKRSDVIDRISARIRE